MNTRTGRVVNDILGYTTNEGTGRKPFANGRRAKPLVPGPSRRGGLPGLPRRFPEARNFQMEQKLKIAVFVDFDNIEIGVKSTLHREFDVAAVLDALKERGEIVTKFAYANWGRQESATRALSEHAVQMVQRRFLASRQQKLRGYQAGPRRPRDAFTHDHINAFAIVSGD